MSEVGSIVLPELDAFKEIDPKYISHLDHSIRFLEQKMSELEDMIEHIGENPDSLMPENLWHLPYCLTPDEVIEELSHHLDKVGERYSDFVERASDFVFVNAFYMPGPSKDVTVFFHGQDGVLAPARFDMFTGHVSFCSEEGLPKTAKELQSPEGALKLTAAFPQDPAYIVSCDLRHFPHEGMISKANINISRELHREYPEFYQNAHSYEEGVEFDINVVDGVFPVGVMDRGLPEPNVVNYTAAMRTQLAMIISGSRAHLQN